MSNYKFGLGARQFSNFTATHNAAVSPGNIRGGIFNAFPTLGERMVPGAVKGAVTATRRAAKVEPIANSEPRSMPDPSEWIKDGSLTLATVDWLLDPSTSYIDDEYEHELLLASPQTALAADGGHSVSKTGSDYLNKHSERIAREILKEREQKNDRSTETDGTFIVKD